MEVAPIAAARREPLPPPAAEPDGAEQPERRRDGHGRELDRARQGQGGGGLHPVGKEARALEPDPAEGHETAGEREEDVVVRARGHVAVHRQEAHCRRGREREERIAARLKERQEEEKERGRAGDGREQPRRAVEPARVPGHRSRAREQRRREEVIERRMLGDPVAHRRLRRATAHPVRHDVGRHDALPLQRKPPALREVGDDRVVSRLVRHIPQRCHPQRQRHRLHEKQQCDGNHRAPGRPLEGRSGPKIAAIRQTSTLDQG